MRYNHNSAIDRVPELVMRPAHRNKHKTIGVQSPDDIATIPQHQTS
jgi:hypothetical protein